ncbi:EVE domain-containing protein [Ancylothrix sp. C2]|uniref:EVE domain-containing protein n=1 Tax=Ancylothrix sp. D3o TaxID=2953691 RepID=UPI0021BA45CF|nr:EVE domain-containing protein [Ancylothrix sp. D3o]MCT7953531.1 EVE domain-containing protein [Ancylothrix sp. D3o]
MAHWLFQGNPKYYRLRDVIRDSEQMPWLVTRYSKGMAVGDAVLSWQAGDIR